MVTMDVDEAAPRSCRSLLISPKAIDELMYSRLIFTLGREAVRAIFESKVLILGCNGVGAEIAKNLVLSGIKGLGLVDDAIVSAADLAAQFLLTEADVGRNRATASARKLQEMNPHAEIECIPSIALESSLGSYQVFVATTYNMQYLVDIDLRCRLAGIPFLFALSRGLASVVFADFGDNFSVVDETGDPASAILVESITQDYPATVTVVEEQRHSLEDGDQVVFCGVKGMEELNRSDPYTVTVTGSTSFTILEDSRNFGSYISGGYFHKVKQEKVFEFLPLGRALLSPKICICDPAKAPKSLHLHVAFQAISECERRRCGGMGSPTAGSECYMREEEVDEVLKLAEEMWDQLEVQERGYLNGSIRMEDTADGFGHGVVISPPCEDVVVDSNIGISGPVETEDCSAKKGKRGSLDVDIVRLLAHGAHSELSPIAAITGGIASQEVIKAISRVFRPLNQWLYFDAFECLPSVALPLDEIQACGSRYDLQTALFGRKFQELLGGLKWLVVGAGGLGSELLKNLVMMGVGCSLNGNITITDIDRVSKPNLVDQLLYQLEDVDRPKTPAAARTLRKINPSAQIHALQEKFDTDTEHIFDSSFFQSISGVFSAVDTAQSRLYIDSRCVLHRKPMIDGGKHGTKGSVQVFVPFQSEMYASSRDPPEHKDVPICTLKNFPYAAEHTLQWAVETFEALFKKRPLDVNAYLSNRDFQDSIRKSPPSSRLPILETLRDALLRHKPLRSAPFCVLNFSLQDSISLSEWLRDAVKNFNLLLAFVVFSFEACVEWARVQFEDLFSNSIKQLCFNFPRGMTASSGAPFWSGTKRAPSAVSFNCLDSLHLDFIVAAANLQATVYGLKGCQDREFFLDILRNVVLPHFEPREGVKIAVSDNDLRSMGNQRGAGISGEDSTAADFCEAIFQELPTPATLAGYRLTPVEFDKDDDCNYHAEFVAAAASLRGCNYGIPLSDKLQVRILNAFNLHHVVACFLAAKKGIDTQARYIGGKVVPAIITSTAVVAGLMCLEFYKTLQHKPLTCYKHAYFNLAVPLFSFAQPIKAIEHSVTRRQETPLSWTLWDRFELDCVGMSLEGFLAEFKQQQGLEITMISYGRSLLYAEFLPKKKLQDRLPLSLLDLINIIGKVTIPATESKITLSISCTDANEEDVEVPDVVARVR